MLCRRLSVAATRWLVGLTSPAVTGSCRRPISGVAGIDKGGVLGVGAPPVQVPLFGRRRREATDDSASPSGSPQQQAIPNPPSPAVAPDEDAAWERVSNDYGVAVKPPYLTWHQLLQELRRFEIRWRQLEQERQVMECCVVATNAESAEAGEALLARLVADTTKAHTMSDMLKWCEAVGVSARTEGHRSLQTSPTLLPFFAEPRGADAATSGSNLEPCFVPISAYVLRDAPAEVLFASQPLASPGANAVALPKSYPKLLEWVRVCFRRPGAPVFNQPAGPGRPHEVLLDVSYTTFVAMILGSVLRFLNATDLGVHNYELMTTLHAAKEVEPQWHRLRDLANLHPAPWPINPGLLHFPGRRF